MSFWQVVGMNRSKCHLLRKHAKVVGEKPLQVGTKLPYARLSLTESTMDCVCEGEKTPAGLQPVKAQDDPSPSTPNTSRRHAGLRAKSGVPITKILPNRCGRFKFSRTNTSSATDVKKQPMQISSEKMILPGSGSGNERSSAEPKLATKSPEIQDKYHHDMEIIKLLSPAKKRCVWVKRTQKPLVTLKTSPSGNNIKFSCTIDRRIFNKGASVAFQLKNSITANQPNSSPPINIGISELTPTLKCPAETRKSQSYQVRDKTQMDHTGDANIIEYQSAVQAEHIPQHNHQLPVLKQLREYSSGYSSLLSTASSSNSSCLSQENLLLYEKQNTLQQSERKLLIDTWITEVNEAWDMGKVLRGREQTVTPGKFAGNPQVAIIRRIDFASKPEQGACKSPQKNLSSSMRPMNGSKGLSITVPNPTLFSTYVDNLRSNKRAALTQAKDENKQKINVLADKTRAKPKARPSQKKLAVASSSLQRRCTQPTASKTNLLTRKRKALMDHKSDQLPYGYSMNKDVPTENKRTQATPVTS